MSIKPKIQIVVSPCASNTKTNAITQWESVVDTGQHVLVERSHEKHGAVSRMLYRLVREDVIEIVEEP
jgi:hypothetical protein